MGWLRLKWHHRELPVFLNVPWSWRDVIVFVIAWMGIQIGLLLLIDILAAFVPFFATVLKLIKEGNVNATFGFDLLDAVLGLGLVWLYLRRYKVGWETVGWRKINLLKTVLYIVIIFFVFVVAANLLLALVSQLDPSFNANQAQETGYSTHSQFSMALIALVFIPPIIEETIFRGFLFPALAKKWGVVAGAIVSSAIFGLAHGQPNLFVYTFPLGLLLCFMYLRLRSIVPGIFLHMINNYLAFLAISSK